MLTFKKILAPLNPSRTVPGMAGYILAVVQRYNAELHLLFVIHYLRHYMELFASRSSIVKLENALMDNAEKQLNAFKNEHFNTWPGIVTEAILGDISEEITRYSETKAMELVILGSPAAGGLCGTIFGSITHRVIAAVTAPVLVINPHRKKERSFIETPGVHHGSSTAVKPVTA